MMACALKLTDQTIFFHLKFKSMKTIFTLLSGLMLSLAVMAAPAAKPKTMLAIQSYGQGDIRVVIDGRRFDPRHHSMTIRNIDFGYHNIKVYRQRNSGLFDIFRNRYELVLNKRVLIRPNMAVFISIDRYGRTTIDQEKLRGNGRNFDWNDRNRNGRDIDVYDRRDIDIYDRNFENNDRNKQWNDLRDHEFDFERGSLGDFDNDYGYDDGNSRAMSDHEFNSIMQSIQKEWFEGNKVKSATQIITTNYMTSAQVKQMLGLFTFEDNKLNLAKQAYGKVVDQRNFLLIVGPVFSHQSSRDELARYVRSYR
jgi:hypothetical protein